MSATQGDRSPPSPTPSPPRAQLRVLTLNVWGLKYYSKLREERIDAITHRLADPSQSQYDIVALQEIWCESTDWRRLRNAVQRSFPYSKFFLGGSFGSGLAILSRYPILRTFSSAYRLNGNPILVNHGDWIAAKAMGCCTIDVPHLGELDVWVTHTIAAGGEDGPEARRAHRISQAYELACAVRESAERGRHVIALGDFNSTPPSLSIAVLRDVAGLTDAFARTHPSLPPHAVSLQGPRGADATTCINELGVTCDSPLCTWTAGKKLDPRARAGNGKRLDYIFYRGPALGSVGGDGEAKGLEGSLEARSCRVSWTERVPGRNYSYSDHFGLEAVFELRDAPRGAADAPLPSTTTLPTTAASVARPEASKTLGLALSAMGASLMRARKVQRLSVLIFSASLTVALGLVALNAVDVGNNGAKGAVCTLLAVVAGWCGTTALYGGLVWGEWEKRTTRTLIEAMELDLQSLRAFGARRSAGASNGGTASRMGSLAAAPSTLARGLQGQSSSASPASSSSSPLINIDGGRASLDVDGGGKGGNVARRDGDLLESTGAGRGPGDVGNPDSSHATEAIVRGDSSRGLAPAENDASAKSDDDLDASTPPWWIAKKSKETPPRRRSGLRPRPLTFALALGVSTAAVWLLVQPRQLAAPWSVNSKALEAKPKSLTPQSLGNRFAICSPRSSSSSTPRPRPGRGLGEAGKGAETTREGITTNALQMWMARLATAYEDYLETSSFVQDATIVENGAGPTQAMLPQLMLHLLRRLAGPAAAGSGRSGSQRPREALVHTLHSDADEARTRNARREGRADGSAGSVECFGVLDGVVDVAGSWDEVVIEWCRATPEGDQTCEVRELEPGQSVVPGLHDAHGHVLDYGWSLNAADLVGADSVQEVVRRLERFVLDRPELENDVDAWIEGLGWDQTKWNPPLFPTAADLATSPLLRQRRIALRRIDVHALWLSTAALEDMRRAHVLPPNGTDIEGGLVVRDPITAEATGILVDRAMDLAYKVIPKWTDEARARYLDAAAEGLLSVGITSVGDAAVDLDTLAFLKRTNDAGPLPLRIYAMLDCPPGRPRCADEAKQLGFPLVDDSPTARLQVRARKLFMDGALGSWGSAMWDAYEDRPDERGLLLMPEEELLPLVRYWIEAGFQVATHAIGDRANTLVLDAYEQVLRERPSEDLRLRVEHAQLLRTPDIPRFGSLGVIASMQPTHCTSDMGYVELRIGAERSKGAYAWKSVRLQNGTLALGSDFPVELPNPFHGLYSSVTRLDANGDSPAGRGGWYPSERLSRVEALRGFTAAPAYAQFQEHLLGSLSRGKAADFAILDRDVLDERDDLDGLLALRDTRVVATFVHGRCAWPAQCRGG